MVLPRVGELQVADQQRGITAQVVAGKGQAPVLTLHLVYFVIEEGDELRKGGGYRGQTV